MDYNKFSNYFGLVAHYKFPKWLQNAINSWYVKKFKIDMSEFNPINSYDSLNALFTRKLQAPRPLGDGFVSPSDGLCLECTKGNNLKAYSIKSKEYKIDELLDKSLEDGELDGEFDYLNIYLSPRDYHHYHAPCDMDILSLNYTPGTLFSVAKSALLKHDNLYALNERVVLKARLKNGKLIWMVFVGALNVGKMKFDFEPRIQTNSNLTKALYKYDNLSLKKGEHIGNFDLGSTIVIITQNNAINYTIKKDMILKQAQSIANIC
ncbi:phosphatidylserine decarboxylase [Campylobacter porcelli]|uniref:phosphatidylserine decarboxylase n=1 Tax=Campylobacter porcelli TaxID=1660073 RepID=A0ABU7M229_9BACT|nr:phosphatidylserine decarboxylase [Campylobacter sp. CX2-4855-23]